MNSVKKAKSMWNVVVFKGGNRAPLVAAILLIALFASSYLVGVAFAQAVVPPHYHDDRYYTKSYVNMFFHLSLSKPLVYVWANASILPCNNTVTLGNATYPWNAIYSVVLHSSRIYATNLPAGSLTDRFVTWNPATGELRYISSAPSDSDWLVNPTNPAGPAIYNLTHLVGIGTSTPSAKLHVEGGEIWLFWSGHSPRFVIGDSPTTGEYGWLQWDSTNKYLRLDTSNAPAVGLKIKDNYVSIGNVYPDAPLKVASGTNLLLKVDSSAIEAYTHLLPSTAGSYDLGSSSNYWRALYTQNASLKYLHSLAGGDIVVKGNFTPISSNTYWLGNTTHAWARLYSYGVNTDDLYPITGSAIYIHGHLNPDDAQYDLGYYNHRWRNLYIKEYSGGQGFIQMGSSTNYGRIYFYPTDSMFVFTKGIRTYPSGAADLGSSTYHWGTLHVDQIYAYNLPTGNIFTDSIVVVSPEGELRKLPGIFPLADNDWNVTATAVYNLTGNVGIGTATPTAKLEVAGTSKMQDILPRGTGYSLGSSSSYWRSTYTRDILSQRVLPLNEREPIELYGTYWFNPKAEKDKWIKIVSTSEPNPELLSGLEFIHPDEERLPIRIGIVSPAREATALWIYGWNGREPATLATFNYTRGEPLVRLATTIPASEKSFLGTERNPWAELWVRYARIVNGLALMNVPQDDSLRKVLVIDDRGNVKWRDASTLGGKDNDWIISGEYLYNLTGKVGIGTATPREKLEVAGNIMASALIDREDAHYIVNPAEDSSVNNLVVNGFLGVGTSPAAGIKFEVAGTSKMQDILPRGSGYELGSSSNRWGALHVNRIYAYNLPSGSIRDYIVTWDPTTKQLRYITVPPGGDNDWTITSTTIYNTWAKVGIGTSSPTEKLEVAGNIKANTIYPRGNNVYDLGTSAYKWRGLYVYNIYPYGKIYGHIVPGRSNTYDIGSSTYKWRDLYFAGKVYNHLIPGGNNIYGLGSSSYRWKSLYVTDIYPYGKVYGHWIPGRSGYYDLGSSTYKWRNLYFTGKVYNHLIPGGNNAYNLGSSSYRWRTLYVYNIYPYGRIFGSLLPGYSGTYDLGSSTYKWRNLYFTGLVYNHLIPGGNNIYSLGSSSYRWHALYVYDIYPYGKIHGHLIPGRGNTYDLGSPTYKWRNIYFVGKVYNHLIPGSNNYYVLGSSSYRWKALYVYNIYPYGRIYGHLLPGYNNNYDLGSSTYKWRNLYFTGKVYNHLIPGGNNAYNLGSSSYRWRTLYVYNIYPYGKIFGHVLPGRSGYYDLGSSTYRWRNVYANNLYLTGSFSAQDIVANRYLYVGGTGGGRFSYSPTYSAVILTKHFLPQYHNSLDLGRSNLKWRHLYVYDIYLGSGNYPQLTPGGYNSLRIRTQYGYVDVGPRNTGWCHFVTDRPSFWFNKKITVQGNVEPYKGNIYVRNLGSSTNRWTNLYLRGTVYLYQGTSFYYAYLKFQNPYIVVNKGIRPSIRYGGDLGSSYYRWNTVYCKRVSTGDLILSSGNATWILFEGADGLYLYNPDTGKQYKLLMEEVPATYASGISSEGTNSTAVLSLSHG